jgi:hypothetical protein
MAKTEITLKLERDIWKATHKQGVFGCFEVTIGWFGNERVDYMTYDTKGIWRCYEIKVSKSDFHSKAHNTFLGHFNYYVMTKELFDQVWSEVPEEIGIYTGDFCNKRAKRQQLKEDEQVLKNSMIRSLYREFDKQFRSGNPILVDILNRAIKREENKAKEYERKYWDLLREVQGKYGVAWNRSH